MSYSGRPAAKDAQAAITRSAGVVALGTFSSRLLGAARDAVIAATFPLAMTDAFFVAWTIPNTLRQVLGEGAVSAAFVPVFSEIDEQKGRDEARRYYARFAGTMGLILALVSAIGVLTAPLWAKAYAAGYISDATKFKTTAQLTALVFPYIFFAGLAALQAGVLNALGRFLNASLSPALLNVALIVAPWTFVPLAIALGMPAIAGLALASLAGGVLQVAAQTLSVRTAGMWARPQLGFSDPAVRKSLLRMTPLLLGTGIYQINILLSRLLASLLPTGSQSFLYYGQRLVEIPQGMLALAVASAALPSLARLSQRGDHDEAKAALRHSLRLSLFLAIPASAALAALALPAVTVLFGRGAFAADDAQQTARSLVWMAAGVWAVASVQGVTRMFYAYGDTRTPVVCSGLNLLCFFGLSVACMRTLGHSAIALANSVASMAQLALLLVLLRRRIGAIGLYDVLSGAARFTLASAAMAFVVSDIAALGDWRAGGNDPRNLLVFGAAGILGIVVYAAVSYVLGTRELGDIARALSSRAGPKARAQ
jgi:putative peptidoglycan lipid II flippase